MSLSYLEDTIKVDTGVLVKAVLRDSAGKQLSGFINRGLSPQDQEVTVQTLTTDIKIAIGIDPLQARRADTKRVRNKFVVPVYDAEIQFPHDDYQRINKTNYPASALVADVAVEMGDMEDVAILTATDITIGDNEGIMTSGNYTDATNELIAETFGTGIVRLAGLFTQLVSGMKGEVRRNAVILVITSAVESIAAATFNTDSSKSLLQAWTEQLVARGGPGSGILVADRLAATVNFDGGVITITDADQSSTGFAALMIQSPKVMTTHGSPYDQRPRPYNKADGYYNKVVQRWINLVHKPAGIIASHAVVI